MIDIEAVKSVVIGHAVADALGVPVEFYSRQKLDAHPRSCLGCQIYSFVLVSLLECADKASIYKGLLSAREALGSHPEFVHYEDLNEKLPEIPAHK